MEEISYSGGRVPIRRRVPKRLALFGIFFLIILLLLGSVAYFATRGSSNDQVTESITLPEESEPEITEEEPTPEESPEPTEEEEPTPTPTRASTQTSSGTVSVQNGSGETGVAAAAAAVLRDGGFSIASTGNADNFDYTDVTIQVKNSKKSILSLLQDALSSDYTIGKTSTDLPESSGYDALVIIGK
ncbi:MAG: LytR C-terminal domain-containing protein [Candidatus Levybacteria bacterium]|nr:LytR C-terminal domain-containing protein [Candidatus Levybacteria bacterium]